ncbi:MAG TPA: fluoride efflux transporter CrcB [Gemmatimonadaceae bacterium]
MPGAGFFTSWGNVMELSLVLYVGLGGAIGSVSRYALTYMIQSRSMSPFPIATLLINVTGSLLLGFVMRYATESASLSAEVRLLVTTGFCGGYTTFSTFSYETARLYEDGDYRRAVLYAALSVLLSLSGMFAGFSLARMALAARR